MQKLFTMLVSVLLIALILPAAEIHDLPDLVDPHMMVVRHNKLFVTERSKVYVYELPDKLIRMFGKKGEGPGEFREFFDQGLMVSFVDDLLCVGSNGRVSYFREDGTFVKDKHTGGGHTYSAVGDGFVALRWGVVDNFAYNRIILKDQDMGLVKVLEKKKNWYQEGKNINPVDVRNPRYVIMGGRIYAESPDGAIHIFDSSGKETGVAKNVYALVEVTAQDREQYHDYYRTHKYYKERYQNLKHLIRFPRYYPPVKFFDASGGFLYVMTHVRKDGKNEVYLYDADGKYLKKVYIKMRDINRQELYPRIRIADNRVYQLFEDDDEENWQLHITEIPAG